jgi:hypothetical protein
MNFESFGQNKIPDKRKKEGESLWTLFEDD